MLDLQLLLIPYTTLFSCPQTLAVSFGCIYLTTSWLATPRSLSSIVNLILEVFKVQMALTEKATENIQLVTWNLPLGPHLVILVHMATLSCRESLS
jgi:hypothetical protein